jgi:hypothetical protein
MIKEIGKSSHQCSYSPTSGAKCPLRGQVDQLKWWFPYCFAEHVNIFHMYVEMGNDEWMLMQHKLNTSCNACALKTTPNLGGTHLYLTATISAVMTQKILEWKKQRQASGRGARSR